MTNDKTWATELTDAERSRSARWSVKNQDYKNQRADHLRQACFDGDVPSGVASWASGAFSTVTLTFTGREELGPLEVADALSMGVID